MPGAYDQGWMRANWISHLVTNWAGDDGWVAELGVRLTMPNLVGDVTWCKGVVVAKRVGDDGAHLVDLSCWGETQRGDRNVEATAVVRLPSRSEAAIR
jgi:acyl dehydratase